VTAGWTDDGASAREAAVEHAVCGDISRSNCAGQALSVSAQVVARASGEDGGLKR